MMAAVGETFPVSGSGWSCRRVVGLHPAPALRRAAPHRAGRRATPWGCWSACGRSGSSSGSYWSSRWLGWSPPSASKGVSPAAAPRGPLCPSCWAGGAGGACGGLRSRRPRVRALCGTRRYFVNCCWPALTPRRGSIVRAGPGAARGWAGCRRQGGERAAPRLGTGEIVRGPAEISAGTLGGGCRWLCRRGCRGSLGCPAAVRGVRSGTLKPELPGGSGGRAAAPRLGLLVSRCFLCTQEIFRGGFPYVALLDTAPVA